MPYVTSGMLTTDKRTVGDEETWDSNADWEAFQSQNDVEIVDGSLQLAETSIPDSAVAHGISSDYDGSQWVADIGPDIPDAGGNPALESDVVNGYPVVRYTAANDDVSQTTTSIASSDPQAVFLVAALRDPGTGGPHAVDSDSADRFAWQTRDGGFRAFRGGSDNNTADGGVADSDFAVYTLEGYDGDSIRLLKNTTEVVSGSVGSGDLSGLTFGARGDLLEFMDLDIAEYTVTEGHTTGERDGEISRLMGKYGI